MGALGPVFRTYEPTRDRLVAVKVFRLDITPEQARALADELTRTTEAGLFHPSIVEPIAAGIEGTVAYRAEEYVAAESLDVALRHYAPAAIAKVLPALTQLSGAIDFARAADIGHGALHPRDIFITPDEVRATGFGVVDALERVGLRAPVRRPYSAPERIQGGPWGGAADVFSLAVIVFELLTGRRPSGTGDEMGSLDGTDLGPYPNHVRAVLARGMHENPDRRYPAALAFAAALEAAARGEGIHSAASTAGVIPIAAGDPDALPAEVHEPAVVTDAPEPDDIAAERQEDEAQWAWSEQEQRDVPGIEADAPDTLFDDVAAEAAADTLAYDAANLALSHGPGEPRVAEEFGDLPTGWAASSPASDRGPAFTDHRPEQPADESFVDEEELAGVSPVPMSSRASARSVTPGMTADESQPDAARSRVVVPLAVMLVIGLLLGFSAGYAVFSGGERRQTATPAATDAADKAAVQEANVPGPASAGEPEGAAQWSEHAVAPSAAPPAVAPPVVPPDDVPTVAGTPPPTPAAPTGRLVVRSTPSRAGVTVNDTWRGRTPLTLTKLPPGKYVVRVVQPGYEVARQELTFSAANASQTVNVRLRRQAAVPTRGSTAPEKAAPPASMTPPFTGAIYVDSRPRGARVYINGTERGTTPIRVPEVPIGSHVVRLELPNHRAWTASVRITAGAEERVTGSLEPIR